MNQTYFVVHSQTSFKSSWRNLIRYQFYTARRIANWAVLSRVGESNYQKQQKWKKKKKKKMIGQEGKLNFKKSNIIRKKEKLRNLMLKSKLSLEKENLLFSAIMN